MEQGSNESDNEILWQGRPAPRCYTFRQWKQALAGSALFLLSSFWLLLAVELIGEGQPTWLALLPLPLIIGSFIFGPAQILLARWRWPKIFYYLSEQRLFASDGQGVLLAEVTAVRQQRQGEHLASLRIEAAGGDALVLRCIEQPGILLALLQERCPQLKV